MLQEGSLFFIKDNILKHGFRKLITKHWLLSGVVNLA